MLPLLKIAAIISFIFSVFSLSIMVLKTFSFGKKPLYAQMRGVGKKGILFALGKGMMPWEKESVSKHLPTYAAGLVYHVGVFMTFFSLLSFIAGISLSGLFISLLRILSILALLSGLSLLFKRIILPEMKKISCPDDFAANVLVDLLLLSGFLHTYFKSFAPVFLIISIILFLYIPLGKIRHCFFFFYVRILFGLFYGRRGVLPQKKFEA
jgi:nitrate reductase gamma subunit